MSEKNLPAAVPIPMDGFTLTMTPDLTGWTGYLVLNSDPPHHLNLRCDFVAGAELQQANRAAIIGILDGLKYSIGAGGLICRPNPPVNG